MNELLNYFTRIFHNINIIKNEISDYGEYTKSHKGWSTSWEQVQYNFVIFSHILVKNQI
jgi:hypothetical protein